MAKPPAKPPAGIHEVGLTDHCIGFFDEFYGSGRLVIPHGSNVLEVGCAEADWLTAMKSDRPDLRLTGLDWRPCDRPGADMLIIGNIMDTLLFGPNSFDAIVAISVLEHVGIGRYGDPIDEAGDMKAMANLHIWLKPTGTVYFDVPYRGDGQTEPFRAYNETDLQERLLKGWRVIDRQVFNHDHADAPYIACVLKP